jgi:hypothetical protein
MKRRMSVQSGDGQAWWLRSNLDGGIELKKAVCLAGHD